MMFKIYHVIIIIMAVAVKILSCENEFFYFFFILDFPQNIVLKGLAPFYGICT
jgi:hypothetical protein